jgi:predicted metal-dependent enzyme (double-stranded beta helix superfamily)
MMLTPEQELSFNCMDGLPDNTYLLNQNTDESSGVETEQPELSPASSSHSDGLPSPNDSNKKRCCRCITFSCLIWALKNKVFGDESLKDNWPARKELIEKILKNTLLDEKEIQKYVYINADIPYTRNMVYTDNEHFTLILMVWNPNKESKIHDHPCDGCFVKTLSKHGVRESRYIMEDNTMKFQFDTVTTEGEINYMDNYLGYHKIGCASNDEVAVTLHLYTPPFKTCKVSHYSIISIVVFFLCIGLA